MTDKDHCPYCGKVFDWELLDIADLWQERGRLQARLDLVWDLANEYLDAFRRTDKSRIALKLRIRHLKSLAKLFEKEVFEYDGKLYRTNKDAIREALVVVCEAQKVGFRNHNYLKSVLLDGAERVSASGHTAAEERKREEDRRRTAHDTRRTDGDDGPMPVEEFKKRIGALADQIGGKSS